MIESARDVRRACRRIARTAQLAEELDARGMAAAARRVGRELPALLDQHYAIVGRLMRELGVRRNGTKKPRRSA